MRLLSSGDGRSGLPTTPMWRDTQTPFSIASICAAGMLQVTKRGARLALKVRSRVTLVLSCASRTVGRHVERLEGLLAHHAVDA